jgi:hypothetical protein
MVGKDLFLSQSILFTSIWTLMALLSGHIYVTMKKVKGLCQDQDYEYEEVVFTAHGTFTIVGDVEHPNGHRKGN